MAKKLKKREGAQAEQEPRKMKRYEHGKPRERASEIVKNKGGRPPKEEGGTCKPLGVSLSKSEREEFLFYAERFAAGNKSELFRRMFKVWKDNMISVVGDQFHEHKERAS